MSSDIDDAIGLGSDIGKLGRERAEIIAYLEQRWSVYPARQRRAFIEQVSFPRDSGEIVGKHFSDIEKEWWEEKKLLARIEILKDSA